MDIDQYREWYIQHYGKRPSEKLIESFCKSNGIQEEPTLEEEIKKILIMLDSQKVTVQQAFTKIIEIVGDKCEGDN